MKIMVVDDARTILHILKNVLCGFGYEDIITCESVIMARNVLIREKIDLIISDWHMPGETGLDLLAFIHSKPDFKDIPFVMLTTEQEKGNIFKAVQSGLQAYLYKPVKEETLRDKLTQLAGQFDFQPPKSKFGSAKKEAKSGKESECNDDVIDMSEGVIELKGKTNLQVDQKDVSLLLSGPLTDELSEEMRQYLTNPRIALVTDPIDPKKYMELLKSNYEIKVMLVVSKKPKK